jgi:arginase
MQKISLLGVPHDGNSSYLKGAADAPQSIRKELYSDAYSSWSEVGINVVEERLNDLGDIVFGNGDDWDTIEQQVAAAIEDGSPLICLGGDHAITHPIMKAMHRRHASLTLLHLDAHPDIYDTYQGNRRSHTSPFARIMEEKLAKRLLQVGLRTINDHHREQFKRFGVEVIEARDIRDDIPLKLAGPIYLSLDLDGLDPAYAPGVAHREPGGLSTRQVINLIHAIDQPIVGADVVEYNPRCDISNLTAIVAAKLIKEIAGAMIATSSAADCRYSPHQRTSAV